MGAAKYLSKATQKNFQKFFAAPGNSAALGYSLESLSEEIVHSSGSICRKS